jgi:hypothetical protein
MRFRVLVSVFAGCIFLIASRVNASVTLNMSHDLISLGIASKNLVPNQPTLDARPLFAAALNYMESHPVQTLTLDKGKYYLLTNPQSSAVLVLPELSNVTIDLAGSTLYFVGPQLPNGLNCYYCSHVTLTNFKIDYLNPPYTHVRLQSVDSGKRVLTYSLLPGWPDPATFNSLRDPFSGGPIEGYYAVIFRNGSIVPGTTRTLLKAPFTNKTLTVQDPAPWGQSATLATLKGGDTVVVTTRGGGPPILVWESDSIILSNIEIYGSATWAVQFFQCSNSVADGVSVVPRPETGLIGSDADGIHFLNGGPNNHIRNSRVMGTMDDALIIENDYAAIVALQPNARELDVNRNGYLRFSNGTAVAFVDPKTTLPSAQAKIVSQSPADSAFPAFNGEVTLTFDRNLPSLTAGEIMVFSSSGLRESGSTIEDNLVQNTYGGRGIWLSGVSGVTVQRNVLRNTSMAGIGMMQETDEAVDPGDVGEGVNSIAITDNVLESSLYPAACGTGTQDCLGAVEVESSDDQQFGFASSKANTNINIANNYIADSRRSGIWLGEVSNGTLENNLLIRSNRHPMLADTWGIPAPFVNQVMEDALAPLVVHYSGGVKETGNTVDAQSPILTPVSMPAKLTVPAAAATDSFTLTTAVSGFAWKAASDSSWLVTTAAGKGDSTVSFSVTANPTATARTGHITIAGQALTVTQE